MKKKLLIVIPVVLLVAAAGAYKLVLAPKPAPGPPPKIAGTVVPLEKEFLVNLAAGRYAKVSVALVVEGHGGGGGHGAGESVLAQEAAVRAAVTDQLTGLPADMLVSRKHRHDVLEQVLEAIHETTDEHVERVLFTDITVQ